MRIRPSFIRLLAVVIASCGLVIGSVGLTAAAPAGLVNASAVAAYVPSAEECQFLSLINDYRSANGVAPLALSVTLSNAARNHSVQMASTDIFSHTLPDGTAWSDNIRNHGYTYNTWIGENLAAGNLNPAYTLLQWQQSPAHNANMLEPSFTAIGIAMAYEPNSAWGYYWTTTFGGYVDETVSC
jgi:uncharacterized protein YkwD